MRMNLISDFQFFASNYIERQSVTVQGDTKKRELLKNPTKIEEIKKKIIDRN